jgi:NADH:quinone reductase (non-electrogenic)
VHRVVILGAGFGGLAAARALAGEPVDVTVVDQRNFQTFQPLLYEVATAGLDPGDVAYPVRAVVGRTPNVRFRLGTVTGVDWEHRTVSVAPGDGAWSEGSDVRTDALPFDSLVVATGAVVSYFGVPGAADHARPLYTLADARRLRDHLLRRLEEADADPARASDGTLTFVVVGGGPTGVEVSGAIAELLDMSARRDGFRFARSSARIVLVDGVDELLLPFDLAARRYAADTLADRTIEVELGRRVARVEADAVELADGTRVPARTVIWAGGVTSEGTVTSRLGCPTGRSGRLEVDSNLLVGGHPAVYAIGDAAAIPLAPGSDDRCPQLAPVAIQSGRHAAAQIAAAVAGRPLTPFRYRDKGIMATIGRRAAIAQLSNGTILRGTLGWLAWFALHLVYLVGFRNKVTVLVNWTWRYLSWPSGPRIIVGSDGPDEAPSPP